MNTIDNCETKTCRYNHDGACSLDAIIEKFKVAPGQCPSCAASNQNITNIIFKELKEGGNCPRFM